MSILVWQIDFKKHTIHTSINQYSIIASLSHTYALYHSVTRQKRIIIRVTESSVQHFGSAKHLKFNFSNINHIKWIHKQFHFQIHHSKWIQLHNTVSTNAQAARDKHYQVRAILKMKVPHAFYRLERLILDLTRMSIV